MLRSFFTQHIALEVDKELKHLKYGIQLLTDENDMHFLSKSLLETAKKHVQIELVIVSHTRNKSIKTTNLLKRLVDSGIAVNWHQVEADKKSINLFAILDKSYVIATENDASYESKEALLRSKVDDFNQLIGASSPMQLYSGDIKVDYTVDKSIVYKGEQTLLRWEVENAHAVSIIPDLGEVAFAGSQLVEVHKNVMYELIARNSNSEVRRNIFIKMITASVIDLIVEVYDPILEDFIRLQPIDTGILKFGVYLNQQIRMHWETETEGKLVEQSLGRLPLTGTHEFRAQDRMHFSFELTSNDKKTTANIHFITFEDVNKINQESKDPKMSKPHLMFTRVIKNLYRKLSMFK